MMETSRNINELWLIYALIVVSLKKLLAHLCFRDMDKTIAELNTYQKEERQYMSYCYLHTG